MANEHRPIAEVSLPTHHPVVQATKPGQHVMAHLKRVEETEMDAPPRMKDRGPSPVPLTQRFHVMSLKKGRPAAPAADKEPDEDDTPLEQVKKNRTKGPSPTPPPASAEY
jgi:hypothetical protein